jgi:hypothetical protein
MLEQDIAWQQVQAAMRVTEYKCLYHLAAHCTNLVAKTSNHSAPDAGCLSGCLRAGVYIRRATRADGGPYNRAEEGGTSKWAS